MLGTLVSLQQAHCPSLHSKVIVEPVSSHSYILLFALQIEKLQQQVSQAVAGRRTAEAEALRRGATLKQLEHRLGELSSEKDVSTPFVHLPAAQTACIVCTVMCFPAQRRSAEPCASNPHINLSLTNMHSTLCNTNLYYQATKIVHRGLCFAECRKRL